ncbi:hypothetical protein C5167_026969 [Papaver somniferum]|nr:hypothetical protein C5167_026969 [Papaver somniferum]
MKIDHRVIVICEAFHVEKSLEAHGSAGQRGENLAKMLMFFEECPEPLGYTIAIKVAKSRRHIGDRGELLQKEKVEFEESLQKF